ncbi:MAG: DNA polymerase I [bacterium]
MKKFVIIDGHALIHRAFHAMPPLTTKAGEPIGAVYGFTRILFSALEEIKPDYIAVSFDLKGPTFRHESFADYKATRVKAPDELYQQVETVKEIVEKLNIPIYVQQGYEADDVIGTVSKMLDSQKDLETIIVTGDQDAFQLVDKNTKVYTMKRGVSETTIFDEKGVEEKFGIKPKQLVDYKSIAGDSSDNIPGVKGIGDKGAVDLLKEFGTLDKIYEFVGKHGDGGGKMKPRTAKLLLEHKKESYLSQELATIVTDVPIEFDLQKCTVPDFKNPQTVKLFQKYEFKSLLPKVIGQNEPEVTNKKDSARNYILIDNEAEAKKLVSELSKQSEIAVDTETTSEFPVQAELVGISFCFQERTAYYVHCYQNNLLEIFKPVLKNNKIKKFGHNIKYDYIVLLNAGVDMQGIAFDTMLASYLLNPGSRQHNLTRLAIEEFQLPMITWDDLVGKGKDKQSITDIDPKRIAEYAAEDADITFRLQARFSKELAKEAKLQEVFSQIDMPLVKVLADMELNGISIDDKYLKEISKIFRVKIKSLEKNIYKKARRKDFNINSTQQLSHILFEVMKLPTVGIKRTQTGFSTASPELQKIKDKHEIVSLIENYRELTKLKSTYVDSLPKLINKKTNRIHASFNQAVTATGRLSSSDPNMQNIPIRTEEGRKIREAFVATRGNTLLSCDYSQIDLRVLAHIAGDEAMIKAFKSGADIHTQTAATVFEKDAKDISKDERRIAKTVNFGVVYGMSPYGLSQTLSIERKKAKDFIDTYFAKYPKIQDYMEKIVAEARDKEYVETMLGRRRYIPEINSGQYQVTAGAERMAINMPVQGTTSDIIKIAMQKVFEKILLPNKKDIKMLVQVHDELLFEVKSSMVNKYAATIKDLMEKAYQLKVPIKVEAASGPNWNNMSPCVTQKEINL